VPISPLHDCLSRSIKNRSRECLPEFAKFTWQLRFQLQCFPQILFRVWNSGSSNGVRLFVGQSKFGLAMVCVRDDEEAAQVTASILQDQVHRFAHQCILSRPGGWVYSFNRFYFHHISASLSRPGPSSSHGVIIGGSGTLIGPVIGASSLSSFPNIVQIMEKRT